MEQKKLNEINYAKFFSRVLGVRDRPVNEIKVKIIQLEILILKGAKIFR